MYKQSLSQNWGNLVSDFVVEHKTMSTSQINAGAIEEWYKLRSFRFSSIAYLEGIEIDQINQPDFAKELREKINDFRFKKTAPIRNFSVKKNIVLALLPSVVASVLVAVCTDWSILWSIIIGIVLFAAGFVMVANQAQQARGKAAASLVQTYANQLEQYLPLLQEICDKYGIH